MVDFNNETTMTRPRKDVLNFMILQGVQDIMAAYDIYMEKKIKGYESGLPELKAKILTLTNLLLKSSLEKEMKKQKVKGRYTSIEEFRKAIIESDDNEIIEIINYLEGFLYQKDVTKWDTKEVYDRTDIMAMNRRILG